MVFFFFNDTATTEIYTLSLHDALPISHSPRPIASPSRIVAVTTTASVREPRAIVNAPAMGKRSTETSRLRDRSEEHTSELQSRQYLVCRLLLEKKKKLLNISQDTYPPQ